MGKIIILTGESGCGKTSIARLLLTQGYEMVTSSTTRVPRPSDLPGEYEHLTSERFSHVDTQKAFV